METSHSDHIDVSQFTRVRAMWPSRKSLIRNGMDAIRDGRTRFIRGINSVLREHVYTVRSASYCTYTLSRTYTHYIESQVSQWSNPFCHKGLPAGLVRDSFKVVSADGKDGPTDPCSPYALTKLIGEQWGRLYARLHSLWFVALRFFSVWGSGQRPDLSLEALTRRIAPTRGMGPPRTPPWPGQPRPLPMPP